MAYLSNSDADIREMLDEIGVTKFEELIKNIPDNVRLKNELELPPAESEFGISEELNSLAEKNTRFVSFLGGGTYDHYIPALIGSLISRSEFYTSYTPYQPEVSQGNLQAMYEFQSMICELTSMDVTNASMYEAGSALAEAILLAVGRSRKKKVLIPFTLNPQYRDIVLTYTTNMDIEVVEIPQKNFTIDKEAFAAAFDDSVGAVVVQHPNYYGFLEDMEFIISQREGKKALLIEVYNPISLGLLKTPGAFGADIAVAEGQGLGNAQNYGGPFIGLFSVNKKLVRQIPGRLSGITTDTDGKRGFVLTLQTREQHIRREKATSNICTNSGLLALVAGIYLSVMGKSGMRELAQLNLQKAHYLSLELQKIPNVTLASESPFFNEFTLKLPVEAERVINHCQDKGVMAGLALEGYPNHLLLAVTEKRTKQEMDRLLQLIRQIVAE